MRIIDRSGQGICAPQPANTRDRRSSTTRRCGRRPSRPSWRRARGPRARLLPRRTITTNRRLRRLISRPCCWTAGLCTWGCRWYVDFCFVLHQLARRGGCVDGWMCGCAHAVCSSFFARFPPLPSSSLPSCSSSNTKTATSRFTCTSTRPAPLVPMARRSDSRPKARYVFLTGLQPDWLISPLMLAPLAHIRTDPRSNTLALTPPLLAPFARRFMTR